jgi:gamma-glutamylcysteine synthetase
MHPLLTLDMTEVWNHDEGEIYKYYDRIFTIHQHGWLNIQSLQVNFSYNSEQSMVGTFNTLRSLLPYLTAVSAASPFVEGIPSASMDSRLLFVRRL